MAIQVFPVEVRDGTFPPTRQQLEAEEEANPRKRPDEAGYKHVLGTPLSVIRYEWRSTMTGKTSNGCTFPSEESAKAEGYRHEKIARNY